MDSPWGGGRRLAARKVSDILVSLDRSSREPFYQQMYRAFADGIKDGLLVAGECLPSIRSLAQSLGVSHITVERAYLQLAVEGFVDNVPRVGYVVGAVDTSYFDGPGPSTPDSAQLRQIRARTPFFRESLPDARAAYDFSFTKLAPGSFPSKLWSRLTAEVLLDSDADLMCSYFLEDGPDLLARELARHLGLSRGVSCVPEQVVVRAGTKDALQTVFSLMGGDVKVVAREEPGYDTFAGVASMFGAQVFPLPVSEGWDGFIKALRQSHARLVFCAPSHQFPTGLVMPLACRVELLRWAAQNDAYIIEDDSCCEYRYRTQLLPSLQSLDRDRRVIYMGNVSKVLSPDLRIAYVVLPPQLLERYWTPGCFFASPVSRLTREALGRFMERGHWDRQVRRMQAGNSRRHDALVAHLNAMFGDRLELFGVDSGMHLYARFRGPLPEGGLFESALRQGARVYSTDAYWHAASAPSNEAIIGFSAIDEALIPAGVEALGRAWLP